MSNVSTLDLIFIAAFMNLKIWIGSTDRKASARRDGISANGPGRAGAMDGGKATDVHVVGQIGQLNANRQRI